MLTTVPRGRYDPKNRPATASDDYAPVETYAAVSQAPVAFTVNPQSESPKPTPLTQTLLTLNPPNPSTFFFFFITLKPRVE